MARLNARLDALEARLKAAAPALPQFALNDGEPKPLEQWSTDALDKVLAAEQDGAVEFRRERNRASQVVRVVLAR